MDKEIVRQTVLLTLMRNHGEVLTPDIIHKMASELAELLTEESNG